MSLVLITGASGHLGANLVRELLSRGRRVRALVHDGARALEGLSVEQVRGDVLDLASLERACAGVDVVYHLAARISIVQHDAAAVRAVNVDGTRNVIEACRRAGVRRLIHWSSIHAYEGEPGSGTIDEDTALVSGPRSPAYDLSKADGERLVRAAVEDGLDAVILNPTGVIGPHDFQRSLMGRTLVSMWAGRLPALTGGGYDWVDARDVVAAAIAAEERAPRGARYLLAGTWFSVREVAESVHRAGGARPPRMVSPLWLAGVGAPFAEGFARLRGRDPIYTTLSLRALRCHRHVSRARAERDLGFAPRPVDDTIRDAIEWLVGNGVA